MGWREGRWQQRWVIIAHVPVFRKHRGVSSPPLWVVAVGVSKQSSVFAVEEGLVEEAKRRSVQWLGSAQQGVSVNCGRKPVPPACATQQDASPARRCPIQAEAAAPALLRAQTRDRATTLGCCAAPPPEWHAQEQPAQQQLLEPCCIQDGLDDDT